MPANGGCRLTPSFAAVPHQTLCDGPRSCATICVSHWFAQRRRSARIVAWDRTCWDEIALARLCPLLLRQLLLELDDLLQGVGVVALLKLQFAFEIGVACFEPCDVIPPALHFQ